MVKERAGSGQDLKKKKKGKKKKKKKAFSDRVKRAGYKARLAAENVGTGQASFEEVMKGWKNSPGHNKNLLLADAEHMGIALVNEQKTEFKSFWTMVVGSSM